MLKNKPSFQEILNRIMAKRFSLPEKIIIALLFLGVFFWAQRWLNTYISDIKKPQSIVLTVPPPSSLKNAPEQKKTIPAFKQEEPASGGQAEIRREPETRDPFLPSLDALKQVPEDRMTPITDLKVSGILWDQKIPAAIINSKVVKIGDIIAGKTIVDMDKDKVILMENGQIYILELRQKSP